MVRFLASYVDGCPSNREILYWGRPPVMMQRLEALTGMSVLGDQG